ncbi:MAG: hypothetical protein AUH30_17995 [Candidatus Rokubacteria bacterium 13_1_40CM_68_15]|nr:MAG: hypothetical protein AUH30_17995 [Candidatus Rokubacteria bacterium 13_1_40CM_68_15]
MTARRWPAARAVTIVVVTALLAGCATAETSAWTLNQQSDCERRGGVWRTTLGFCEYQSGGGGGSM